jgi:hypothetical protein
MKGIIVGMVAFTIASQFAVRAQVIEFKRYNIESGIVEYTLSGMQSGTSTLYFDQYGMREASYEETTMEMMGMSQETETVNYLDGVWQYTWDKKTNSGTKIKNTMLASLVDNAEEADLVEVGYEMLEAMGGVKIGEESVLDKPCEIWEVSQMGTKIWVWEGITMKSQTSMMGFTINRVATSLQAGAAIPEEMVAIPDDIEFKEVQMPAQFQNMMNNPNND